MTEKIYGCRDRSLSEHLKCIVTQGEVAVIGQLPEGVSSSLQHNWQSPFQSGGAGSVLEKTMALGQHLTGRTLKGYLSFLLTWEGSEPESFSIPLMFESVNNPEYEVDMAVRKLKAMSAPRFSREIKDFLDNPSMSSLADFVGSKMNPSGGIGNRIPESVTIGLGRKLILPNVKITSVEVDDPMHRTRDGFSLKQSVTLNITTASVVDAVDILARGVTL